MKEQELRAFVTAADIGQMDEAAESLGYSQSAISYQIRKLEQEVGVQLFDRNSRGVELTSEGMRVLPTARAVLDLFDGMRATVDDE